MAACARRCLCGQIFGQGFNSPRLHHGVANAAQIKSRRSKAECLLFHYRSVAPPFPRKGTLASHVVANFAQVKAAVRSFEISLCYSSSSPQSCRFAGTPVSYACSRFVFFAVRTRLCRVWGRKVRFAPPSPKRVTLAASVRLQARSQRLRSATNPFRCAAFGGLSRKLCIACDAFLC